MFKIKRFFPLLVLVLVLLGNTTALAKDNEYKKNFDSYDDTIAYVVTVRSAQKDLRAVFKANSIYEAGFVKKIWPDQEAKYIYSIYPGNSTIYFLDKMTVEVDGVKYELTKSTKSYGASYEVPADIYAKIVNAKKSLSFTNALLEQKDPITITAGAEEIQSIIALQNLKYDTTPVQY